jgi:hypothetical protein
MGGCGLNEVGTDRERWRAVVNAVMKLLVPSNAGRFLTSCKPVSLSRTLIHGVSKYGKFCLFIIPVDKYLAV